MAERVSSGAAEIISEDGNNPIRARWLALDLLDARRERDEAIAAREKAERELDELRIENGQICEKLVSAQRGEDIPGLVRRIAKAERELATVADERDEARKALRWLDDNRRAIGGPRWLRSAIWHAWFDAAREKGEKP
jgi:hypothetical protein